MKLSDCWESRCLSYNVCAVNYLGREKFSRWVATPSPRAVLFSLRGSPLVVAPIPKTPNSSWVATPRGGAGAGSLQHPDVSGNETAPPPGPPRQRGEPVGNAVPSRVRIYSLYSLRESGVAANREGLDPTIV